MLMPNLPLTQRQAEELRLALAVEWLAKHVPAIPIRRLCPITVEIGRFTVGLDSELGWCLWECDPERPDYCSRLDDAIADPARAVSNAAGLALSEVLDIAMEVPDA